MAEKPDYYAVLGVAKTATKEEIEKAYKAFAFKNHPDRLRAAGKSEDDIKAAEQKLSVATEAKTVLCDPAKRRTYDSYGHEGLERMAKGSSSGTGQSYSDAAGTVRIKKPMTEGDLFDFFDKRKEHGEKTDARPSDGLTSAERRARAAEERAASRRTRLNGGSTSAPPPANNNGSSNNTTTTPRQRDDDDRDSSSDEFNQTAQKVSEAAQKLQYGMAAVPVDVLIEFRNNLQDFIDHIDRAIDGAGPSAKKAPRP